MRSLILGLMLALPLSACAHGRAETPPICDGKHLRSANPYGSVLAPQTAAPSSNPPAAGASTAIPPKAGAPKTAAPRGGCGQ